MPWRKPWINPEKYRDEPEELEKLQIKRAYEVWVSEISEFSLVMNWVLDLLSYL